MLPRAGNEGEFAYVGDCPSDWWAAGERTEGVVAIMSADADHPHIEDLHDPNVEHWHNTTLEHVQSLIQKDPGALTTKGGLFYNYPIYFALFGHAKFEVVKAMLERIGKTHEAGIKFVCEDNGDTLLHLAADNNDFELIPYLLAMDPELAEMHCNDGKTALERAQDLNSHHGIELLETPEFTIEEYHRLVRWKAEDDTDEKDRAARLKEDRDKIAAMQTAFDQEEAKIQAKEDAFLAHEDKFCLGQLMYPGVAAKLEFEQLVPWKEQKQAFMDGERKRIYDQAFKRNEMLKENESRIDMAYEDTSCARQWKRDDARAEEQRVFQAKKDQHEQAKAAAAAAEQEAIARKAEGERLAAEQEEEEDRKRKAQDVLSQKRKEREEADQATQSVEGATGERGGTDEDPIEKPVETEEAGATCEGNIEVIDEDSIEASRSVVDRDVEHEEVVRVDEERERAAIKIQAVQRGRKSRAVAHAKKVAIHEQVEKREEELALLRKEQQKLEEMHEAQAEADVLRMIQEAEVQAHKLQLEEHEAELAEQAAELEEAKRQLEQERRTMEEARQRLQDEASALESQRRKEEDRMVQTRINEAEKERQRQLREEALENSRKEAEARHKEEEAVRDRMIHKIIQDGEACHRDEDDIGALEAFQKALSYAEESNNLKHQVSVLRYIGRTYQSLNQSGDALKIHQRAHALALKCGNRREECLAYGNLGDAYAALDEIPAAIHHYNFCIEIAVDIPDFQIEHEFNEKLQLVKAGRALDLELREKGLGMDGEALAPAISARLPVPLQDSQKIVAADEAMVEDRDANDEFGNWNERTCSCGFPNAADVDQCVLCGKEWKQELLRYSSDEVLLPEDEKEDTGDFAWTTATKKQAKKKKSFRPPPQRKEMRRKERERFEMIRNRHLLKNPTLIKTLHDKSEARWEQTTTVHIKALTDPAPEVLGEAKDGNLPMHLACRSAHFKVIKQLYTLYSGSVQEVDADGNTPLHLAIRRANNIDIVSFLFQTYPEATLVKNKEGLTPIAIAARANDARAAALCLTLHGFERGYAGAVSMYDTDAERWKATEPHHIDLFAKMCPDDFSTKNNGLLPMHHAILGAPHQTLRAVFKLHKGALSTRGDNGHGDTPLHLAARHGRVKGITFVLNTHPAAKTVKNTQGQTALEVAISAKRSRCIARLLGLPDHYEGVWSLYDNDKDRWKRTKPADVEVLHKQNPLLVKTGQDVVGSTCGSDSDLGGLPLHHAVRYAGISALTAVFVLNKEALHEKDGRRQTPFDVAIQLARLPAIALFLGCNPAKTNVGILFQNVYDAEKKEWKYSNKVELLPKLKIEAQRYRKTCQKEREVRRRRQSSIDKQEEIRAARKSRAMKYQTATGLAERQVAEERRKHAAAVAKKKEDDIARALAARMNMTLV